METRKTEIRYTTSDPEKMLDKYLTQRVLRSWKEDFVDNDTGKTTTIERHEVLFDRGIYINADVLTEIKFWLDEGSLKEVEVSNQKRMSFVEKNTNLFPFKAVAKIDDKRNSFLLYATSVSNAIEILSDYIELNYFGGFFLTEVKELDYCVILVDKLKTIKQRNIELDVAYLNDEISVEEYIDSKKEGIEADNSDVEEKDDLKLKFYQIGAKIIMRLDDKSVDDEEFTQTFIVQTFSAVRANLIIEKYLRDKQEERYLESLSNPDKKFVKKEILSFIEESKIINAGCFIPRSFSEAYCEEDS